MLTTRRLAILVSAVALAIGISSVAHADPIQPVDCGVNPAPGCTVEVENPGQPGGGGNPAGNQCRNPAGAVVPCYIEGKGSLGSDGCYYEPIGSESPPPGAQLPGSWYLRNCVGGPAGGPELVWLPDSQAPISPEVLAMRAVSQVRLPAPWIQTSPASPTAQLVFLPTWLWLDAASWGPRSATASVPGMSVTATATPARVTWSTGDGATRVCSGPGTPWRPGMNPHAASPTCGHTYRSPSTSKPGGVFMLRATVTWQITWVGGGSSGTVAPLATSRAVTLRVVEAQALNGGAS